MNNLLCALLDRPALAVVLVLAGVLIAGLLVSVPLHGGELIVKVSIVEIRLHGVRQPTT
jgi:hypothetical protein